MRLEPGTQFGHFEIVSLLGAGGMGEVYRARDGKLGREVAVKVLPDGVAEDPGRLARFEREARALATLNHPGIAAIHQLEEADGVRFLVLELVEGETLSQRLRTGPLRVRQALDVSRQVAESLASAHERGVIHRDLKPSNIQLTPDGRVKLLDFGLAKLLDDREPEPAVFRTGEGDPAEEEKPSETRTYEVSLTGAGHALGTLAYMSPEQARGEPLDKRTDVWSFGCVLYELLTGRRAFGGKTRADVVRAVLEEEPDLGRLPLTTPAPVRSLLRRCLSKDRGARLREIADVGIELGQVLAARERHRVAPPLALAGGALALVLAAFVGGRVIAGRDASIAGRGAPVTVAVLPFDDLSPDPAETAYVSDGIAESLATRLTSVPALRVVPWLRTRQYRDAQGSFQEVARELRADTLLVGTFSKVGDQIQGSIALIDEASGLQRWSMRYAEPWGSIFDLQERIATSAVESLIGDLTPEEAVALAEPVSTSPGAYDLYLRGASRMAAGSRDDIEAAQALFAEAAELDPTLAEAQVGIGAALLESYTTAYAGNDALDGARRSFEAALEIEPALLSAFEGLLRVAYYQGHGDRMQELLRQMEDRLPDTTEVRLARGVGYSLAGLNERALALLDGVLETHPGHPQAMFFEVLSALGMRDYERALDLADELAPLSQWPFLAGHVGQVLHARGEDEKAAELLGGILLLADEGEYEGWWWAFHLSGLVQQSLGDDETAEWLWRWGVRRIEARLDSGVDQPELRGYLALLHAQLHEPEAFRVEAERVLSSPNPSVALEALARGYATLGDRQTSLRLLHDSLSHVPLHAEYGLRLPVSGSPRGLESLPEYHEVVAEYEAELRRLNDLY